MTYNTIITNDIVLETMLQLKPNSQYDARANVSVYKNSFVAQTGTWLLK